MPIENDILNYCREYNVPIEYLMEILNDQKVLPMIRGKASEYNSYLALKRVLPVTEWTVTKLNLNAQPNTSDQDVSIMHRRTGMNLTVETKNAVRGSFKNGLRAKICVVPHFRIKCHRSRSNMSLATTSNDRYAVGCFDIVISNVSNAIIQGNTIGERLELLHNPELLEVAKEHYGVSSHAELLAATNNDWRFALSRDIAEDGFIPRTPLVRLINDPHWKSLDTIERTLLAYLTEIRNNR